MQRFDRRFLYGGVHWNRTMQLALISAGLTGFGTGIIAMAVAHSRSDVVAALSAAGVCLATVFAAWLTSSARRATETRRSDLERTRSEAEALLQARLVTAFEPVFPVNSTLGFSATYVPASTGATGGDWYDAFELPDGRIMFSIGDVSGHGLEAAVMMSRARQAIFAVAVSAASPGDVFERANTTLMLQDTKFATAICGYIDPTTLHVTYATAGHPPALLVAADGQTRPLSFDGLPLGVAQNATYPTFELDVEHGSMLVLYTDGLLEYDRDLLAGERRIAAAATLIARQGLDNPAAAIRDAIFAGYTPTDDVAIMTISFVKLAPAGTDDTRPQWSVGFRGIRAPLVAGT